MSVEGGADSAVCTFLARAWWGDRLLAESTATIRVDEPDEAPSLYFPRASVRLELFEDHGHRKVCPAKGGARLWSLADRPAGEPRPPTAAGVWGDVAADPADGTDVAWSFDEPAPSFGWLSDLVAFDHERVRVELIDSVEGEPSRDVSIKRFPTWGDAAQLIELLDVEPLAPGRYVSVARSDARRPVVEGSQMLGQAIVAAGRHAPGRRAVSAHMVFLRAADARQPLEFALDELAAGRTFTTLTVRVSQNGRDCAAGTLLLDVTAPDVIRHAEPPPAIAGPYECESYDMAVTGRDIRMVDDAYTDDPDAPVGPPILDSWVRYRDVPDDPYLHQGLLAQFTGHLSIAAALRPHVGIGQREAHRTLSTAINAITLSIHGDVRADEWMLYRHLSTVAADGMTHSECRVHGVSGELLASFAVDAMVRRFNPDAVAKSPVDDRTAL